MKLFLAISSDPKIPKVFNQVQYPYVLNSFAYPKSLDRLTYLPDELTLDSGAFTAWNSGKSVDIQAYADYCVEWQSKVPDVRCVNLDVIPGEAGRTSTTQERLDGMRRSLENADYLRSRGLRVEEVFHQDEPFTFLDQLLERLPEGEVLCLSPRNDVHKNARIKWLQNVLAHLVRVRGKDNLPKTHGLAVTNPDSILSFPFYSVDSSTYASPARYGRVIDHEGNGTLTKDVLGFSPRNNAQHEGPMRLMIVQMIDYYKKIEAQATTTWKRRGIVWED